MKIGGDGFDLGKVGVRWISGYDDWRACNCWYLVDWDYNDWESGFEFFS